MRGTLAGQPARVQRGGLVLGLMIGVVIGLAVAVAVAIFVTRAPLPFVNKVSRAGDRIVEPKSPAEAPDPNRPPSSRGKPPEAGPAATRTDPSSPAADPAAPQGEASSSQEAAEPAAERQLYVLQAGAFRSADDADSMKGKLALIGLEARVQPAEVNGQRVYRVRIGPYGQLDDVNRAKARLEENGIESTVMRQR